MGLNSSMNITQVRFPNRLATGDQSSVSTSWTPKNKLSIHELPLMPEKGLYSLVTQLHCNSYSYSHIVKNPICENGLQLK